MFGQSGQDKLGGFIPLCGILFFQTLFWLAELVLLGMAWGEDIDLLCLRVKQAGDRANILDMTFYLPITGMTPCHPDQCQGQDFFLARKDYWLPGVAVPIV